MEHEPLKVRLDDPRATLPTRSYDGDAGYDLYVLGNHRLSVGATVDLPMGVSVQMPPGWWGLVCGRSSTIRSRGLLIVQGVIDQGYRGPMFASTRNMSEHPVNVADGERVAQLVMIPLFHGELEVVQELDDSDRGAAGFGSTGV